MFHKWACILILPAMAMLVAGTAWAACTLSTTPVLFGNYDVFLATATDSTGTVSISCDQNTRVVTAIGISPNSGGFDPRQMKHGVLPDLLNYNLYTRANRQRIWGDGTSGTFTVRRRVNRNRPRNLRVQGRIPPLQDVSAGPYIDILVVTITF